MVLFSVSFGGVFDCPHSIYHSFMMEELSDTESADMSIEDLSPSNPKMSDSPYQTVEKTASDKNHDIPRLVKDLDDPEHNVSLHGSFGIGNYVSQIRSCSPVSCQQHNLVAPSASPGSSFWCAKLSSLLTSGRQLLQCLPPRFSRYKQLPASN